MRKILSFFLFLGVLCSSTAADDIFLFNGYFKSFSTAFLMPSYKIGNEQLTFPDIGALTNRLRIKFSIKPTAWLSLNTAYDFSPRIQDPVLFQEDVFFADIETGKYRFADFRNRLYPEKGDKTGSFGLFHNLDRFYVSVRTKLADIYMGRQAIAWGSARIINPTDVIAPFTFNELDPEERKGVDAVRMRIPLGMMDEIDLGYVAGEDFKLNKSAFFIRGKTYLAKTDISLLCMRFYDHLMIGMDIARSIGGAGFWIEAAWVNPYFFEKESDDHEKNYVRASVGLDYNLNPKTYGYIEYHFNSAGKNNTYNYPNVLNSTAFHHGYVYLLGRHYAGLGLTYRMTPLLPFSGLFLFNMSDGSLTLAPKVEYNIESDIYISAGAYIGIGQKPEYVLGPLDRSNILFHSEFGAYPDMIFTSFRIYF